MSLVMSFLSISFLALLTYFFVRRNRKDTPAIAGYVLKIIAGISLGLVYRYYYEGGDTFQYFKDAGIIANFIAEYPGRIYDIFFRTTSIQELAGEIAYFDQPRALFFTKIITVFYLIAGGNYWIISAFLSVISFFGAYILVREISSGFKVATVPAQISFYFLPSFVFWTSGLLKESLAVSALLVLIALTLKMIRRHRFTSVVYWAGLALSGFVLWELKYFYAAVAFPIILSLLIFEYINSQKRIPGYYFLHFLFVGVLMVSQLHYNLSFAHVSEVIYQNYQMGVHGSDSSFQFLGFDGSAISYLMNLPLALVFGLFRPLVFEPVNILQFLVGFENTAVLVLSLFALWKWRSQTFRITNHFSLAAFIYIISIDIFLAFSTPNFGTLSRYKVGFWPFFVMLVLLGLRQKKSGPRA